MMTRTVEYLEAARRALGGVSDYRLAKRLDVSRQAISRLLSGERTMSPTTAARVAILIGVDPMRVIADMELERGADEALWKGIRRAVALLLLTTGAAYTALPSLADAAARGLACVLCKIARWIASGLAIATPLASAGGAP